MEATIFAGVCEDPFLHSLLTRGKLFADLLLGESGGIR